MNSQQKKDPTLPADYSPKADNSDIPFYMRIAVCPAPGGQLPDMNEIRAIERKNYEEYLREQMKNPSNEA
ncbi:hypothetical protein TTHERM_00387060 (macronuclear) [Tetrahymena thermophila SB210]|uniref:Uncharacterized protein n=1 Tax=Tetrahymena thermophila (strain SB210) TaxID=312017 RepID=Q23RI4_TETTS|nr:hypothetical protein TTHERM_00387060 [Tetrahymena thermophila SB210]EAR99064.1 hypothetical protein TTHERM_00387060 [Tetrahymena thermophila SB210]|eukprot:XP_001019309.1 hypothetical protein TTHERM_00387060 [Tetrahymena thermophila SB210]